MKSTTTIHDITTSTVGIVFVNYHSEALIGPRADLLAAHGHPVVVADNSATLRGGSMKVIDMNGNAGFAVACNRGVEALGSEVETICLHNPDVDISPAAILELAVALRGQTVPGVVAPAERVGSVVRLRGYHYPAPLREVLLAMRPLGGPVSKRPRIPHAGPSSKTVSFSGTGRRYGGGALLVIDRTAWARLGGFDERYFMYCEDLDLWHRMGLAGYERDFCRGIVAVHHSAGGSPGTISMREIYRWLGVELFLEAHAHGHWRTARAVHRRLLWRHRPGCPLLAELVAQQWRTSNSPSEVIEAILPKLRSGEAVTAGRAR